MAKTFITLLFLVLHGKLFPDIVLNEIMCNVKGSDTRFSYLEFIEVYNIGQDTVDLLKLKITDLKDTNDILKAFNENGTTRLPPDQIALILDPDYPMVENPYNLDDTIPVMTIATDRTIGNTLKSKDECVFLFRNDSLIDQFCWYEDPGDGISWERIDPEIASLENNWAICGDPLGATPGKTNSVYKLSVSRDESFKIISKSVVYSTGQNLEINIANIDKRSILRYSLFDLQGFSYGWLEEGSEVLEVDRIIWNGRLPNGDKLDPGLYIFHIELKSLTYGEMRSKSIPVGISP